MKGACALRRQERSARREDSHEGQSRQPVHPCLRSCRTRRYMALCRGFRYDDGYSADGTLTMFPLSVNFTVCGAASAIQASG